MAKKRKTTPKANFHPDSSKTPRFEGNPNSYLALNPAWRISQVEFVDPYGWHTLDSSKVTYIQKKLSDFESMTWSEILVKAKKFHHSVKTSDLSKDAKSRLCEIKLDDLDELLSLRLDGLGRVWGIFDRGVLNILWWDPKHQVYPYQKKNT